MAWNAALPTSYASDEIQSDIRAVRRVSAVWESSLTSKVDIPHTGGASSSTRCIFIVTTVSVAAGDVSQPESSRKSKSRHATHWSMLGYTKGAFGPLGVACGRPQGSCYIDTPIRLDNVAVLNRRAHGWRKTTQHPLFTVDTALERSIHALQLIVSSSLRPMQP